PMAVALANAQGGEGVPAPEGAAGSSSFPAPPPLSTTLQPSTSVFTYFPGSGNQPPMSPPPSMRGPGVFQPQMQGSFQGSFTQGQPGQPGQPMSPIYQQGGAGFSPVQGQQSFQPYSPQQQQFQAQGGYPQQGGQASVGANSQLTTKQMAAAVKSKKKAGAKW
ncbi:hypothetical protein BGZ98_005646, partial [Dissophora globulifera]